MKVKKVVLNNFRNYENESIGFCDNINIIYGDNAQGKTNILESINMFSVGRSNRTYKDTEVIKFGQESSKVYIDFTAQKRENSAEIDIFKNKKKIIKLNEIPIKRNSELIGKFNVIYFGPEYLSLIKDGPKKRRKNVDVLISQLRPNYFIALYEFKKITEQKNALLKAQTLDKFTLDILNEKFINTAIEIMCYRQEYIKKIEKIACIIQKDISLDSELLEIKYVSSIGKIEDLNINEIKDRFISKLKSNYKREIEYRETIIGPHRDDIEFFINGYDVKNFGSQGQQKTCILVQKIAEVQLIKEEKGEYPVLLLDDIMSELDNKRQDFVLNNISDMQILITCTDKERFNIISNCKFIHIDDGRVKRVEE